MKKGSKTLKILLIALIIILISIISFIGIYNKGNNNLIPEYLLGRNIQGSIVIKYTPSELESNKEESNQESENSEEVENTENTEESKEENVEESSNIKEETTEDIAEDTNSSLTEENFIKSKKIIQKRLDDLGLNDYEIRLNNTTGEIYVIMSDDDKIDSAIEVLSYEGKFEIRDAETDEVLLNNDDISDVKVGYGSPSGSSSDLSAYITINFNKQGANKLLDISNQYVVITDEEGNTTEKKVSLKIEDQEIVNTYFSEPLTGGKLQLSLGSSTSDTSELKKYLDQGSRVAVVLSNGKLPLKYTSNEQEYVKSDITLDNIMLVIYILMDLATLDILYIIVKYKKNGVLSAMAYIASIAIVLLVVRYTNTPIAIESTVSLLLLILFNHYIYTKILNKIKKDTKSEEVKAVFKEVYKSCIDLLIVLLIISVVFVYVELTAINSMGMLLFWGIIAIIVSNYVFGRTLLIANTQKEV